MEQKEGESRFEKVRLLTGRSIEEGLIILFVILGIVKFLGVLPGDIDFISNLVSWITLSYLLYEISFSKLFLGEKEPLLDLSLIISILLLQVKDFLVYFSVEKDVLSIKGKAVFHDLFVYTLQNQESVQYVTFSIGTALIIALSIYMGINSRPKDGSMMYVLFGETKDNENILIKIKKTLIYYFVIISVFLFIISPLLEWIAISLDAPLVIIAIFFYITQSKRFKPETFIFKLGDFGENIFESFINLFKSRATIFLGVFSIFGVKIVVDMISYTFPLVTGYEHSYYLNFDSLHQPVFNLFRQQITGLSLFNSINLGLIYMLNIIAIFMIFFIPAYIWYALYKKEKYLIPNFIIVLFFLSISVFAYFPLFSIKQIIGGQMIGVDIMTQKILNNPNLVLVFLVAATVIFLLLKFTQSKKQILMMAGITSLAYLTVYFVYFFISTYQYYLNLLSYFFKESQFYFLTIFITFFLTNILFFIIGYLSFLLEYRREFRNIY